ncbi:hypothetical protein Egran_02749 [Elaphomyces granulatus]|uniref:Uncharacterized protein n=1 Tax=Elaphomyces granulatus TaxID=519963 RepID=A0A232LZM9_9EURO|nr:hypothetical protein Egran_02749 [Elaphomyces granulatus]
MYQTRAVEPLAIRSTSGFGTKTATFAAAAFQYTDDPSSMTTNGVGRTHGREGSGSSSRSRDRDLSQSPQRPHSPMGLPEPMSGLYVRALYDYETNDQTSLSFKQGDVIQVLNQLETGWWDGIIGNVRGWFPSNYCAIIPSPDEIADQPHRRQEGGDVSAESGAEDEYDDEHDEDETAAEAHAVPLRDGTAGSKEQEEAAFWIPQATSDGRLFYFNTLTGSSTMELPLENPLLANETGPRDRTNFFVPDQTRPPPEIMARGFERDEDDYDGSGSEGEGESLMLASRDSLSARRQSLSEGASPATSMDSLNPSPLTTPLMDLKGPQAAAAAMVSPQVSIANTNALASPSSMSKLSTSASIPRHFVDDGDSNPVTWTTLLENMHHAVDRYRQALLNGDRSEYVRRAEDISDHLRMLLAAGSDTTDNHSGNPSIISTNKALYPHFRDMMSKFSKLVLSSHLAAADWPGQDSGSKCLQEADGVLRGVYGYVEVARQQRGDDIKRLVPGFVLDRWTGGNWQNNGLRLNESTATSFLDPDGHESHAEPSVPLDATLLEKIDASSKSLVVSIRKLEEHLTLTEKIVTSEKHKAIGQAICDAAMYVLEQYRPLISTIESINMASLGTSFRNPQLVDFGLQKQKVYETIADFVLGCQGVSAPLGDEWAELRGESLDDRLDGVRNTCRHLENYFSQINFSLSLLQEQVPGKPSHSNSVGGNHFDQTRNAHTRPDAPKRRGTEPSVLPSSFPPGADDETEKVRRNQEKAHRFFGQAPPAPIPREPEETPWYLRFDHEGEVFYDTKSEVPTLKCGTLAGLVEQLTRHDKLDASFNNTFLLTYRSFTSAAELFEMLVQRFNIQPPYGLNKDELQVWMDRKQKPIRFRVVNILKTWFENYWMEPNDESHMNLLRRVHAFTKDSIATTKTPGSPGLMNVIDQRLKGQDTTVKRLVPTHNVPAPTPILPKNMKKLKFLDIDATEFARQLTIIESRLYAKIRPIECLNKTWQKKVGAGETEPAANVKALILHSNQLTNWVAEMVLTQSDVKKRVVVIKHFVNVADRCRNLNNFSTLTSIISALGTAPIHRLNRTWAQVSARTSTVLEQMRQLMASTKNFGEYRETLHQANPPCIPFFGVYLTDLTFIEDGIPSHTPSDLINFNKRAKTAEVIRDIQQYQNVPYLLQPVSELQDYILSHMQSASDVHEMYERSLEVEPRERDDEKITR